LYCHKIFPSPDGVAAAGLLGCLFCADMTGDQLATTPINIATTTGFIV
jgi:hypothetical protein